MTDDDTIHIDPNGNPVPDPKPPRSPWYDSVMLGLHPKPHPNPVPDPKPPPDRWYDYVIFGLGPTSSPVKDGLKVIGIIGAILAFGWLASAYPDLPHTVLGLTIILSLIFFAAIFYLLPALVGSKRGVTQAGALWLVNILIGWTLVGWLVCPLWAVLARTQAEDDKARAASE